MIYIYISPQNEPCEQKFTPSTQIKDERKQIQVGRELWSKGHLFEQFSWGKEQCEKMLGTYQAHPSLYMALIIIQL
jgi:hypothetical protein